MYTTQRATPSASGRWYTRVTGSNLSPMAVWREVHAATPTLLLVLPLPPAISNGSSVGLPSLFQCSPTNAIRYGGGYRLTRWHASDYPRLTTVLTPAADKSVTLYVRQFWSTARNSKVPELLTSCRQLPRGWLDDAENPNSIAQCPSDSLSTMKDDVES